MAARPIVAAVAKPRPTRPAPHCLDRTATAVEDIANSGAARLEGFGLAAAPTAPHRGSQNSYDTGHDTVVVKPQNQKTITSGRVDYVEYHAVRTPSHLAPGGPCTRRQSSHRRTVRHQGARR